SRGSTASGPPVGARLTHRRRAGAPLGGAAAHSCSIAGPAGPIPEAMQCDSCDDAFARKRDAGLHAFGARHILGMRVDASTYARAVQAIFDMAETGGGTTCVATVHMVMEAYDDPAFQRIVNAADLVTSDGMPLVWALRARGLREAERVYGPDL